jgi:hypothetical protein
LDWANHDLTTRKPNIRNFVRKINLEEIAPQLLIEVIQNPAVAGDTTLEKEIRDSLTNILSRKFDGVNELDEELRLARISRSYDQQDVSTFLCFTFAHFK